MEEFAVSFQKVIMEREDSLYFISFKDEDLASCCSSAQRKLLFQLKCAFGSLPFSLAHTHIHRKI